MSTPHPKARPVLGWIFIVCVLLVVFGVLAFIVGAFMWEGDAALDCASKDAVAVETVGRGIDYVCVPEEVLR